MVGLVIVRMGLSIPLMLPSACSHGEISLRSFEWAAYAVRMKLLWIYLLALDILCYHSLSGIT